MPKIKPLERTETPETTNTAIRIILKDLDALIQWAEADARASVAASEAQQFNEHKTRARTYRQCRGMLTGAFK